MFCRNCGKDIGDARYCPYCGSVQEDDLKILEDRYDSSRPETAYDTAGYYSGSLRYGVADRMREIFRDTRFLVITILMTVNAVASLFSSSVTVNGTNVSLTLAGVFPVLFCIALWLCYAEGKKQGGELKTTGLAMASGTAKAMYIVVWVVIGISVVAGVFLIIGGSAIASYLPYKFIEGLPGDLYQDIPGLEDLDIFNIPGIHSTANVYYERVSNALFIFIGIALILIVALLIVLNIFFYKKLHRFTKSVCESVRLDHLEIACAVPVKNWLIVSAVLSFIGAAGLISTLSGFVSFAGNLCGGVAAILASILIKRYFVESDY